MRLLITVREKLGNYIFKICRLESETKHVTVSSCCISSLENIIGEHVKERRKKEKLGI